MTIRAHAIIANPHYSHLPETASTAEDLAKHINEVLKLGNYVGHIVVNPPVPHPQTPTHTQVKQELGVVLLIDEPEYDYSSTQPTRYHATRNP